MLPTTKQCRLVLLNMGLLLHSGFEIYGTLLEQDDDIAELVDDIKDMDLVCTLRLEEKQLVPKEEKQAFCFLLECPRIETANGGTARLLTLVQESHAIKERCVENQNTRNQCLRLMVSI